jgi:UDP-3-O-[3-hydroxymyristoyl] N-acetylglucosamine deacetylase
LHSGKTSRLIVNPAEVDTGIVFRRADLEDAPLIKAVWSNVVETELSTVLGNKAGVKIATIEHLLSAIRGLDIDNALIDIYGEELPILDGSSSEYVDGINKVGIAVQDKARKYLQILKPVSARIDDKFVYFLPSTEFKITCRVNYSHPFIGLQDIEYVDKPFNYSNNICRAKTFGFLEQVEDLQKRGFALGGSYDNAIVLGAKDVVNKDKMSYEDEFVRHKILDIVGDMALCEHRLIAHLVAYKSGHALHNLALKELSNSFASSKLVEEALAVDEKKFAMEVFSLLGVPVSK